MGDFKKQPSGFATKAIHYGQDPEQNESLAVVTPIVTSTIFKHYGPNEYKEFEYGRLGNPTRQVLETALAALDNGEYALAFSSGMGATTSISQMLNAGDHLICCEDVYGGSSKYFREIAQRHGFQIEFVDCTGHDLDALKRAIRSNTKMIWLESPTNPCMQILDITAISKVAHEQNSNLLVIVDNSFLSAFYQRPLELGADIVMYSLTKYMNGHSDIIMGAAVMKSPQIYEQLKFIQTTCGIVPSPFDCYQLLRSLKTLNLRMERHQRNGLAVGKFLETHPFVTKVLHPGLPSHPQHEIALKQSYGHSGIMAFYILGGMDNVKQFFKSLKLILVCGSLGGFESIIEMPTVMSHFSVPPELKARVGITDSLVRFSCGLEDVQDIINDLDQALRAATHV